jgi:RNA polymerase sigma factor (sigma-70 family)
VDEFPGTLASPEPARDGRDRPAEGLPPALASTYLASLEQYQPLEAALPLVLAAVRQTARRYLLSREDEDELRSYVFMKLLEDGCRRLKKFRGESSLHTYLVVIVKRLFLDLRIQQRGKWRPSAAARRGGDLVERVEELVSRDGYSPAQAYEYLTTNLSLQITAAAFDEIVASLPVRVHPSFDNDLGDAVPDERYRADAFVRTAEEQKQVARVDEVWDAFVTGLAGEDRLIWALHYDDELKSSRIAQVLGCPVEHVYSRVDRIKELARRHLVAAGITPDVLRRSAGEGD